MSKRSGRRGRRAQPAGRIKRVSPRQMARKRRDPAAYIRVVACVLVLLVGGLLVRDWLSSVETTKQLAVEEVRPAVSRDPAVFADSVASQASEALVDLGVPRNEIAIRRLPEDRDSVRWEVRSDVPGDLPLAVCNLELTRLSRRLGGEVIEGREDGSGARLLVFLGMGGERTNRVVLHQKPGLARTTGRIAIVVDDVGYQDRDLVEGFIALKQRVTLSIFPGYENTAWIAERAVAAGHGVMVHLPMEPIDYPEQDPGPGAIFAEYPEETIRALTRKALASVPHARGVNNHMGSRVTEDRYAIGCVLKEVYSQGFYFVDSVTSPRSVACDVAREVGVPCRRNTLFLDHNEEEVVVEQALGTLAKLARRKGTVIGIGHARPATLAVLQRELTELEQQGFVFVKAEEVVR